MKRYISAFLALGAACGLSAQTTNLVVEENDGTKTAIPTDNISGVLFEEAPEYDEANYLLKAVYAASGENGTYTVDFGTDAGDEIGDPLEIGGCQVSLQLVGPQSEDRYNAAIPEGYYRIGDGTMPFTFNINASGLWQREEEGSEGTVFMILFGGSVDVKRDSSGEYDIRMELTSMGGLEYNLRYKGKIDFSVAASEFEPFTEDQSVIFEGGQERFYGNWFYPFADDGTMQFYTGSFTADGMQIDGYWLNIEAFFPKSDNPMDPNVRIPDGEYKVDPREKIAYVYNPYTFLPGRSDDVFGQIVSRGTYITRIDASGRRYLAYITEGTFTVSGNGTKVDFDFTTDSGLKITGSYEGKIIVGNFCDIDKNPAPERPYSTITDDRAMQFVSTTDALYFAEPETYVLGYKTYQLYVMDMMEVPKGDFVQLTILEPEDADGLPDGTYSVSHTFGDNTVIPGAVDFAHQGLFSWLGNMEEVDEYGYQLITSPIEGGSFTISDAGDGKKILTFDFTDDAGHKLTGSWTGVLVDYSSIVNGAPAARLKRTARN